MKIAGVRQTSLYDGIGINYVIFFQGCRHHCEGCHNPQTWDETGGATSSVNELKRMIEPYLGFITGITFSGGDPVLQYDEVLELAWWAKSHKLTTTLYTGYTLNELRQKCLDLTPIDYIVDGEYEKEKRSVDCPFRGSTNQAMYCYRNHAWESCYK